MDFACWLTTEILQFQALRTPQSFTVMVLALTLHTD